MVNVKRLFKYKKLINWYPPYLGTGISLKSASPEGNDYTVQMKLRWYNRNVYGTHFGGSLYAMVDPFFVFAAYAYFGDEYVLWDQSASIRFVKPGKSTVYVRVYIPMERLAEMKEEVDTEGKKTFTFETRIYDDQDNTIAEVHKEIYVKKKPKRT